MVNLCEQAGCHDSCCFGSYFIFSDDQFLLWMRFAGNPELDELSPDSYMRVSALTDRRNGTGLIMHTVVDVEGQTKHMVKVDGECPVHLSNGGCKAWGQFNACNGLLRTSKRCAGYRKRDDLPPLSSDFAE